MIAPAARTTNYVYIAKTEADPFDVKDLCWGESYYEIHGGPRLAVNAADLLPPAPPPAALLEPLAMGVDLPIALLHVVKIQETGATRGKRRPPTRLSRARSRRRGPRS